jgi:hypothetical protein
MALLALAAGCSSSGGSSPEDGFGVAAAAGGGSSGGGSGDYAAGSGSGGGYSAPAGAGTASASGDGNGGGDGGIPSDVLTAGTWDDNLNYDFFNIYLTLTTQLAGAPPLTQSARDAANALFAGARPAKQRLDVAIVIDTTGSMGDEAAYLSTEFQNISAAIEKAFPNADQHWGLVAYRDRPDTDPGDEYVVRSWDFTSDLSAYQTFIGGLTAGNGGDYPEAPDLGLATGNALSWRTDPDVARLEFWVADAPHHDQYAAAMAQDFTDASAKGVHIYPVSASGADELLEDTMRSGAQLTGGRYLFLTDDSGIGDTHLVPTVPCYYVTRLGQAMVRMVSNELSGVYTGPDPADVIRVAGDPSAAGQCQVGEDGGIQTVTAF